VLIGTVAAMIGISLALTFAASSPQQQMAPAELQPTVEMVGQQKSK
jgi:hypothetical protein